jgi:glycosyltransferase involved in cell wall biosynthesis
LVPYGGDPWKLDPPDIDGLARAVISILDDQTSYRTAARRRAENAFGLDRMVEGYLNAMNL